MQKKVHLRFWEIVNMSMGFLGIQFGFALQNANASTILQTFGADVHHLNWFWLVAPITGMVVQPIIGYYSDRTWTRFGRRRPYFLAGAILTGIALIMMPNAPHLAGSISPLLIGGGMLMIMDASMNISMEPFRALVADKLPDEQHTLGFSTQTLLIGIGAVIGSTLPWVLHNIFGVNGISAGGYVSKDVTWSFYIGAMVLMTTIIISIVSTKEYPPEFYQHEEAKETEKAKFKIPKVMIQLLLVQFFSWFALFSMWVYTAPAVAQHFYGTTDPNSELYKEAGRWVGILFGVYNGVSALVALFIPLIARKLGRRVTHSIALAFGALAFFSFFIIKDPVMLILPMLGIGIAWASILAMPYAILANSIPPKQMGIFMGIFNMSITIPQIVNGVFGGIILQYILNNNPLNSLIMAGLLMALGAISVLFVKDKLDLQRKG